MYVNAPKLESEKKSEAAKNPISSLADQAYIRPSITKEKTQINV